MSTAWIVVLVLSAGTYVWKAAGPLALGNRTLPALAQRVIGVLPAPLLAALVVTSTVADGRSWTFDARLVGLSVAIAALIAKRGFITVVLLAAIATALARAAGMN
jgi:branched-subunit amino acid transport protein